MALFDWFQKKGGKKRKDWVPTDEGERPRGDADVLNQVKKFDFPQEKGPRRLPVPSEKRAINEQTLEEAFLELRRELDTASKRLAGDLERARAEARALFLEPDEKFQAKIDGFAIGQTRKPRPSVEEYRARCIRDAQEGVARLEQRQLSIMEAAEVLDQEKSPAGAAAVLDEEIRKLQEETAESASSPDLKKKLERLKMGREEIENRMRLILPEIWNR